MKPWAKLTLIVVAIVWVVLLGVNAYRFGYTKGYGDGVKWTTDVCVETIRGTK